MTKKQKPIILYLLKEAPVMKDVMIATADQIASIGIRYAKTFFSNRIKNKKLLSIKTIPLNSDKYPSGYTAWL